MKKKGKVWIKENLDNQSLNNRHSIEVLHPAEELAYITPG